MSVTCDGTSASASVHVPSDQITSSGCASSRLDVVTSRKQRKLIAEETLDIVRTGQYVSCSGKTVNIGDLISTSVDGSRVFDPNRLETLSNDFSLSFVGSSHKTKLEVTNETTFSAARRLVVDEGLSGVCVLNFASGKNAGGGFLKGSHAQEESIARCSSLYHNQTQRGDDYYRANRVARAPFYTHNMIWTPQVPVFRDDITEDLLNTPYTVDIVTAPAVNAGCARKSGKATPERVNACQVERIDRLLSLIFHHGNRILVLGAWGCGVFGNKPEDMASSFATVLNEKFRGAFSRVVFAVHYTSDPCNFDAFANAFPTSSAVNGNESSESASGSDV